WKFETLLEDTKLWLMEFQWLHTSSVVSLSILSIVVKSWVHLSSRALKLNVDAAPGSRNGATDIRVVVRDASSVICGVLAKNFPRNFGLFFLAKSLTLRDGLSFALNYNLIPKFLESNSRNIIFALNDEESGSLEGHILKDSSNYLS
ncbi:hypothetical protein TorRG33x02_253400, partial [Trema orientale]